MPSLTTDDFSFDGTVPLKILLLHMLLMFLLEILIFIISAGKYLHCKAFKILMVLCEENNLILKLHFYKIKS